MGASEKGERGNRNWTSVTSDTLQVELGAGTDSCRGGLNQLLSTVCSQLKYRLPWKITGNRRVNPNLVIKSTRAAPSHATTVRNCRHSGNQYQPVSQTTRAPPLRYEWQQSPHGAWRGSQVKTGVSRFTQLSQVQLGPSFPLKPVDRCFVVLPVPGSDREGRVGEGGWSPDAFLDQRHSHNDSGEVWERGGDYYNNNININIDNYNNLSGSSLIQAYYEQLLAHPHIAMRDGLSVYVMPVLIVFGNVSNVLTFAVLRRKTLGQHSVCFYLALYALANVLVLNLILGVSWLCVVLEKPYIAAMTDWGCRLWTFVSSVVVYCGIWFVVVLSADRVIYLCYSHKATTYCTLFAAKVMSIIVVTMLVVVSIHAMWTFELQAQGCFVSPDSDDLHIQIWPLWSATIYSYLPLTLLLVLNVVLSVSLCLKQHRQRRSENVGGSGGDDFTVTTLVVAATFFLLTVPATVINAVDIYFPMSRLSLDLIAQIELTKKVTEILSALNQTLLGLILLVFSKAFRREVCTLLSALTLKRRPRVYEMRQLNSGDCYSTSATRDGCSNGRESADTRSHIEYEVCNSADVTSL
ncbi:uncharacterized protein LOC143300791 [Babylonia areolata]|uniref:uncharacterized protein LOC143300791 n=1 Tax=Babylonia areolata TaxID=304850 RepID=UPI003FD42BFF